MTQITERVDQIFADWDKPDSPGCALAVIKDGCIMYSRGYGMANLELNVPINPQSIFDIGSTSKQFTALCTLLLSRKGKLSLDDPIQKYLPEIPEYEQPITIRHLIHHTSGIRDYLTLMALANMPFENDYQEPEVVALIARQKALNFLPGEEHLYCNSGYFLLSEIVWRVSGKNLRDFAEENVFGPLGMKHTHYHNNFKEIVPNRASAYGPREGGGFEIDMGIFDVLGDGAVYTSVEDLFLWDCNYYDNKLDGGGQELIRQMEQPGVLNNGEKLEYAFGLMLSPYRGLHTVSHGGSWYGYRAQMLRFPDQHFSVICLSNLASFNPDFVCKKVADIYLENVFPEKASGESIQEAAAVDLNIETLLARVGKFQDAEKNNVAEILVGEESLVLDTMGQKFPIEPLSENHFRATKAPVALNIYFENDNNRLIVDINDGYQKTVFEKIAALELTAAQLAEYTGRYFSDELNMAYEFTVGENMLNVKPATFYLKKLEPLMKDSFNSGILTLVFQRDETGKVTGFNTDAGRVKDIVFKKTA